jgi:hypothetical protein
MQHFETNKFLLHVSNLSNSIFSKLDYQKNFLLLAKQVNVKEMNQNDTQNEIAINKKTFSLNKIDMNKNISNNKSNKQQQQQQSQQPQSLAISTKYNQNW